MRITLEFQADLKVGKPECIEQGGSPKADGSHQATKGVDVEELACPLHDSGLDPVPPAFQLLQAPTAHSPWVLCLSGFQLEVVPLGPPII